MSGSQSPPPPKPPGDTAGGEARPGDTAAGGVPPQRGDSTADVRWGLPDAALGFFAGLVGASLGTGVWVALSGTTTVTLGSLIAGLVGLWTGYLGTCLVVTRLKGTRSFARDFGLRLRRPRDVALGVVAGLVSSVLLVRAVYSVLVLLHVVSREALERLDDPAERLSTLVHGRGTIVLVLLVGLGAPIIEELFFRGLLQRALVRRLGSRLGIGVGAAVFGAAHLQPLQFPALAAFGVVLGVLAHRSGTLGPGIVAHVVFNGLTLASLFLGS